MRREERKEKIADARREEKKNSGVETSEER
jgi:hypothetical protein